MTRSAPSRSRSLIRESDLRRFARISSEEGVTIRSRLDPDGGVTITINPAAAAPAIASDSLDARLDAFGAS
ncbi:hypothetical protein [Novosphingobium mathurense]|uniref:Uncharacterized protein n=1 Tax=Novosphingobium mathurense TaxID=428990 RepID=A0A1U6IEX7_9SPHN|nr:hypothetical protein [Novosphingobium mathurense]SLK06575.1 hypothetical protein SAMN06295987_10611 [Novosphingobium mathurense]